MRNGERRQGHHRGFETLESRIAMSHAPSFGAVGDSLTDEYRFYPPDRSQARNWVETLAATRKIDFGSYSTKDRGFPRDQGYANNWAKQNAVTSEVVASQLPGLALQVAAGKVNYVSVGMGTNDFLFFAEEVAAETLAGKAPSPADFSIELATVEANAAQNFHTTVNTLLVANPKVKVIVQTTPDIRQVPIVAESLGLPGVAQVANAIAAEQAVYNALIREVGTTVPRVGLADIAALGNTYASGSATTLPIGGIKLNLTTTGDDYHDAILADKIHPGTVAQGLIADAVIEAADGLGAKIKPLSPVEIVNHARFVASHSRTSR